MDILISIAPKRDSVNWVPKNYLWDEFKEIFKEPKRTFETVEEYKRFSKDEKLEVKDIGGFLAGKIHGKRRKVNAIVNRTILTLDVDFADSNFLYLVEKKLQKYTYIIHSTHGHTKEAKRYRLLLPLASPVEPVKYEAIARKLAELLGFNYFDGTTFDPNRLMFWPSAPLDAPYHYSENEGEILTGNYVLKLYENWQDVSEWKFTEGEKKRLDTQLKKKQDPTEKEGLIGAFCRAYTVQGVIEKWLSKFYEYHSLNRYTYKEGTTSGGVVVYDKGKFIYSFHNTDPLKNQLLNSFDLYCFYMHNNNAKEAVKAIKELEPVKIALAEEKIKQAKHDFNIEANLSWMQELEVDHRGKYVNSSNNLNLIFNKDKGLKGKFAFNVFDKKRYVLSDLPWRKVEEIETMRNEDYAGIRNYIESLYGIYAVQKVDDCLTLTLHNNEIHPLKEKLSCLQWDGIERIPTLLTVYFSAERCRYTEEVMKKWLIGGVKRVFEPGCKFDYVLALVGSQGIRKSDFFNRLGMGYYSDSFTSVTGKESFEQLQGNWLLEIAELAALKKAEIEATKHYITKREDIYRPPYQRVTEIYKRQCIFAATTNEFVFLKDLTGNRRFWPVLVGEGEKSVKHFDKEEVEQVWAEAMVMYKNGEQPYLSDQVEEEARKVQEQHAEELEKKGTVIDFLNTPLPENWEAFNLPDRQFYFSEGVEKTGTVQRKTVCILEIWCEMFGNTKNNFKKADSYELKSVMESITDWEYTGKVKRTKIYGSQRYYQRKEARKDLIDFDKIE